LRAGISAVIVFKRERRRPASLGSKVILTP
jgi:hypothetical protein